MPINPEYKKRKGLVAGYAKANLTSNTDALIETLKLIDAFIRAREKGGLAIDWIITSENRDYSNDKCYYIWRWLNHSFIPFTNKQKQLYKKVREAYCLKNNSK